MKQFYSCARQWFVVVCALLSFQLVKAQIPAPTVDGNLTICSGGSTVLTASLPGEDETNIVYTWYTYTLLGLVQVQVYEGNPFETPALTSNYYYQVEARNTVTGQVSPQTEVLVTVSTLPNLDVVAALPADLIMCMGDSTSVTATSIFGYTNFRWYNALVGGDLLFEGNPYNTGALSVVPSIYVTSVNAGGCESTPRLPVPTLSVIPALDVPIVTPTVETICQGDSVTLEASSLLGGVTFLWYDTILGGTPIATGPSFNTGAIQNAGAVDLVKTYYAEIVDGDGCRSLRTPAVITVLPALDVPLVNPLTDIICTGDSAEFVASSLLGSPTFRWYDALVGGTLLHTGDTYNTGEIDNAGALELTRIFYVEAEDVNGCTSLRTPATLVIRPALDVPVVDPVAATACSGDSVTFTATSLLGGVGFNWYDEIVGGNLLDTGRVFTTDQIVNGTPTDLTTIFYVEAVDAEGCKSLRIPATVVSVPNLDAPLANPPLATACSGDSVTFTATSLLGSVDFNWYEAIDAITPVDTGEVFNTGAIENNGAVDLTRIYYLEAQDENGCKSVRTPVTVVLTPALDVPLVDPLVDTTCNGGSGEFVASSLLGSDAQFHWYDVLTGGTPIFTGDTFVTPTVENTSTLSLTRIYYVEVEDASGCRSVRLPVTLVVLPNLDVPLVDPLIDTICSGQEAVFTATSLLGGNSTYRWYDALVGGTLLFEGNPFNTGQLENSGTLDLARIFYVEEVSEDGCVSLRTPATVVILPAIDVVAVLPLIDTVCSGGSTTFSASTILSESFTYNWYDAITGGTLLHTGNPFETGPIENNTPILGTQIFYVEGVSQEGCKTLRTPATVVVVPALDAPLATPLVDTVCNGTSAEFTASSLLGAVEDYNWYNSLTGSDVLHTGETFVTEPITNTGLTNLLSVYYVEGVTATGCKTIRTPVTALVTPALDLPIPNPLLTTVCSGQSAEFTATSLLTANPTFNWYDAEFGGTLLHTGDTFVTEEINNTSAVDLIRIYFVEVEDEEGCKSLRLPVEVLVTPALDAPLANPPLQLVCSGDSVEFVGTSLLGSASEYRWYDELLEGNLLFVGDTFNTGVVANTGTTDLTRIYYLELVDTNGCKSLRTPATAVFRPALAAPVANPPVAIACNGDSAMFVGTSLLPVDGYNWYDNIVGGTLLFSGDTFYTPAVVNNGTTDLLTTYFLEAVDTAGCKSLRTPAIVTTLPAIDVPLVEPLLTTICNGDSVEFVATSLLNANGTFRWYDDLLQGTLLHVGDTFNTGAIENNGVLDLTQIYYVEVVDSNGCASLRIPATVLVRPALTVPLVNPVTQLICNGQTATLTGAAVIPGEFTFRWYDELLGGNLLFEGDTFTTEPISNQGTLDITRLYYLEAVDTGGCVSLRTPGTVVVRPALEVPVVSPPVSIICNGDSVELVGTSLLNTAVEYNWYDDLLAGNLLFTGDTFNTGAIQNTTGLELVRTYFLEAVDSAGCRSLRTPGVVTVRPALEVPLVDPLITTICSGDSVEYTATDLLGTAETFRWYDALLGGNLLAEGDTFNTGAIVNEGVADITALYFVEAIDSAGCASLRTPGTVVIQVNPDLIILDAEANSLCMGESTVITATSTLGSDSISWFTQPVGGEAIFIGEEYSTGELLETTTYYVESYNELLCKSRRFSITINVADGTPLSAPRLDCASDSKASEEAVFVWNAVEGAVGYEVSTDNGETWKLPSEGQQATTHIETRESGSDELGIAIVVRAINNDQPCAPKKGNISDPLFCPYGEVIPEPENIVIYNSFSPNGDGTNDTWGVTSGIEFYPDNSVMVVNRWGKVVFEATGYDNSQTVFTGEGLEDGAYFYVVKIPSLGIERTGYVMIIR